MEVTHYGVLGLRQDASLREVKQAFRRIALLHHPDRGENADVEKFKRALAAHDVLVDQERRQAYDTELRSRLTFTVSQRQTAATAFSEKHRPANPFNSDDNPVPASPPADNDPPRQQSPKRRPYRSRFEKESQQRHDQSTTAPSPDKSKQPDKPEAGERPGDVNARRRRLSSDLGEDRGRKRSRFDLSELNQTPPLTATYGNFDLHNVFSAMPDRPPPRQTYHRVPRAPESTPRGPSYQATRDETVLLQPRFFSGPQIPPKPPKVPQEATIENLETYWREYLQYSQSVASSLLQGTVEISTVPLQEIVNRGGIQGMHQIMDQTRRAMDGWIWATNECKGLFMDIGYRGEFREST